MDYVLESQWRSNFDLHAQMSWDIVFAMIDLRRRDPCDIARDPSFNDMFSDLSDHKFPLAQDLC